jgi:hypothetical protein
MSDRRVSLLLAALLCLAAPASSHPPYERAAGTILGSGGQRIHLVRAYVDGIVLSDPVKLVLRDDQGVVLDETDYVRDVSLLCPTAERCLVFLFDGATPLFPIEVLRLSGTTLVPVQGRTPLWLGLAVHLQNHALGYLVAVACFALPLIAPYVVWRLSHGVVRVLLVLVVSVAGTLVLASWLWVMYALTEMSLPIALALVGCVAAAVSCWAIGVPGPRVDRAGGPTRA